MMTLMIFDYHIDDDDDDSQAPNTFWLHAPKPSAVFKISRKHSMVVISMMTKMLMMSMRIMLMIVR